MISAEQRARDAHRTDVFMALGSLMSEWRDDPDRLAVAVAAYRLSGYGMEAYEVGRGLSDADAQALIQAAMYRRNKRLLEHRARGLLMALDALGPRAMRDRLHEQQVESAVIECRVLPIDERIAKLREMSPAPHPTEWGIGAGR
jgi:hypothetical protein